MMMITGSLIRTSSSNYTTPIDKNNSQDKILEQELPLLMMISQDIFHIKRQRLYQLWLVQEKLKLSLKGKMEVMESLLFTLKQ
jgi:hypothetical protein